MIRRAGRWLTTLLRRYDLIPPPAPARSTKGRARRGPWHTAALALLWIVFAAYLAAWVQGHWGWLADPLLQNDDARTSLFPYHRFGPEAALRDDPIANSMMLALPPAQHLLYWFLVPLVGLFWSTKIVQLLCLAMVAAAAIVLARARRGGLAAGLLLCFFLLHSPYVIDRMAGGHARGFAFPLMALWFAGAVARSERCRWTAALLAAPLYFPALALILGGEALLLLRGGLRWRPAWRGRLGRLALLGGLCGLLMLPQAIALGHVGRMHTLEEAEANPAFTHSARKVLPLAEPAPSGALAFVDPYLEAGRSPLRALQSAYGRLDSTGPLVIIAALALLVAMRLAPTPWAALAFVGSTIAIYSLARVLAFRLYNPERYYAFGMQAASIMLAVGTVGLVAARCRDRRLRETIRRLAAAGFIAALCVTAGDGVLESPEDGMYLDGRRNADLIAFARTLPVDARIACHPGDAAGLSFWAGRATTDNHETLQPWIVELWRDQVARTSDTLRALYAADLAELAAYCDRYGVTHLLINVERYDGDIRERARLFPPFDEFTDALLDGRDRNSFVVRTLGARAVFERDPWIVFDVGGLAADAVSAGGREAPPTAAPDRRSAALAAPGS